VKAVAAAVVVRQQVRRPEDGGLFGILHVVSWQSEPLWHHTHHRRGCSVDEDGSAQNGRVAAVPALPQRITEDDGCRARIGDFVRRERPSQQGLHAEHVEQVGCDRRTSHARRLPLAVQVRLADRPRADGLEHTCAGLVVAHFCV